MFLRRNTQVLLPFIMNSIDIKVPRNSVSLLPRSYAINLQLLSNFTKSLLYLFTINACSSLRCSIRLCQFVLYSIYNVLRFHQLFFECYFIFDQTLILNYYFHFFQKHVTCKFYVY